MTVRPGGSLDDLRAQVVIRVNELRDLGRDLERMLRVFTSLLPELDELDESVEVSMVVKVAVLRRARLLLASIETVERDWFK